MQTITAQHNTLSSVQSYPHVFEDSGYVMDPQSLAYLNYGLFQSL